MKKSKDCKLDLVKGQASRPYKRIGRHLRLPKCIESRPDMDGRGELDKR